MTAPRIASATTIALLCATLPLGGAWGPARAPVVVRARALAPRAAPLAGRFDAPAPPPPRAPRAADDDTSEEDPRVYEATISRRTGIDFGCNLSLRWPYVLALVPGGAAELHGGIALGDQLIGVGKTAVVGADISEATSLMYKTEADEVKLTLFRGSRAELQQAVGFTGGPSRVTITVREAGKPDVSFAAKAGCNLRDELVARKINVYRSLTRWTNCSGKQLCGTCIVDVQSGLQDCSRRSIDEASTLRENPLSYRLSCVTTVYGDVTVEVQTPVGASQWTR